MRTLLKMRTGPGGQKLRMHLYIGASSSIGSSSALERKYDIIVQAFW